MLSRTAYLVQFYIPEHSLLVSCSGKANKESRMYKTIVHYDVTSKA